MAEAESILIVLSGSGQRKPRAGRIEASDKGAVMVAAAMQGYRALPLDNFIDVALIEALPQAELTGDGRLRVPPVKAADHERLLASIKPEARAALLAGPRETASAAEVPEPWASIAIGDLVLGCRPDVEAGWYESIVVSVFDDLVTLRFRDYPAEREYTMKRAKVGVILA